MRWKRCVSYEKHSDYSQWEHRRVICSIMFGTATLKARLSYAVWVRVTWSRGLCEESSDIEEPVNWRGTSWWRYVGWDVDCILYAKVLVAGEQGQYIDGAAKNNPRGKWWLAVHQGASIRSLLQSRKKNVKKLKDRTYNYTAA